MWYTPEGERRLEGAEAKLIREAMGFLCDMLEMEIEDPPNGCPLGIPVFDRLQPHQRLALLAEVCHHLLVSTEPSPELTAVNEGAIGALFRLLENEVVSEVECEDTIAQVPDADPFFWRGLVIAAYVESEPDDTKSRSKESAAIVEFKHLIEILYDRILWDCDYLDEDLFVDLDPEVSAGIKQEVHIPTGYFGGIAPDPTESELEAIRTQINMIYRGLRILRDE